MTQEREGMCPECYVKQPWGHGFCEATAGCNTKLACQPHWKLDCDVCLFDAVLEVESVEVRDVGTAEPVEANTIVLGQIQPDFVLAPWSNGAVLPTDSKARKRVPLCRGVLDYFPAALSEVARLSWAGNQKHNPGEDLHHARGKSPDHADCILRHLMQRGEFDEIELDDGEIVRISHSVHVAWRALALLQEELEAAGAPRARGAR